MHNSMLETNSLRWRLRCEQGDHFWDYLDEDQISNLRISDAEKHFLGLDNDSVTHIILVRSPFANTG